MIFLTLPVLLQRWCSTCHLVVQARRPVYTPRKNRERPESGICFEIFKKNTIFNEHLVGCEVVSEEVGYRDMLLHIKIQLSALKKSFFHLTGLCSKLVFLFTLFVFDIPMIYLTTLLFTSEHERMEWYRPRSLTNIPADLDSMSTYSGQFDSR